MAHMKTFKVGQQIELPVHGLGSSGEGVGYYQGYTVFVDGALPEEIVAATLTECKKTYGRAELIKIIKPSPLREKPVCHLFGKCGGCQLMHLDYQQQLVVKQQKVIDALQRIGKIKDPTVSPCLPSPNKLHYRNKIQLPVKAGANGLLVGLYARSSHDLVEVDSCHIHCDVGEKAFQITKRLIKESGIKAYDPQTGEGELRHILIKSSMSFQESLIILVTQGIDREKLIPLARKMMQQAPQIKGVVQNINHIQGNIILGDSFSLIAGSDFIHERLGNLTFKISPASFFQVNTPQAECLYAKALELSEVKGNETILDAYCGVGTISLYFAKHVKKVIGVECVPEAIVNANENAKINEIQNAEFVCANSEDYIKSLDQIDLIILNPPRKGCEKGFLEGIQRLRPSKIIYISCDPATLARDLAYLSACGYAIKVVQPFDMFPQTAHVECVVKLELA